VVGPVRIGFGCLTGAGSIVRKDEERPDRMILAGATRSVSLPRRAGVYPGAVRIFNHNIRYMAGLAGLYAWYVHVRPVFARDPLSRELIRGLQDTLVQSIKERIRQLEKFCDTLGSSRAHAAILSAMDVVDKQVMQALAAPDLPASGERLISWLDEQAKTCDSDYITAVQQMPSALKTLGSNWLLAIEMFLVNRLTV
jgi:UDP-N-acetylglucosamine/UDP-N-acetylgalactosamine diphosphorylase